MKSNKKGDIVVNNVLEVVVAVICIGLIIYFIFYLYNAIVNQEKNQAIAIIDSVVGKIEIIEPGEKQSIAVSGPCKSEDCPWFLAAYSITQINKPTKCFDKSCLCLCKEGSDCQLGGYCKAVSTREINMHASRSQFKENILQVGDYTRFKLKSNFITIEAERNGDVVDLYVIK